MAENVFLAGYHMENLANGMIRYGLAKGNKEWVDLKGTDMDNPPIPKFDPELGSYWILEIKAEAKLTYGGNNLNAAQLADHVNNDKATQADFMEGRMTALFSGTGSALDESFTVNQVRTIIEGFSTTCATTGAATPCPSNPGASINTGAIVCPEPA